MLASKHLVEIRNMCHVYFLQELKCGIPQQVRCVFGDVLKKYYCQHFKET